MFNDENFFKNAVKVIVTLGVIVLGVSVAIITVEAITFFKGAF